MHHPEPRPILQRILSGGDVSAVPTGTPASGLWIFAAAFVGTIAGNVLGTLIAFGLPLPRGLDALDVTKLSGWACGFGVLLALAARRRWFPPRSALLPTDLIGAARGLVWIAIVVGLQSAFDALVFDRPPGSRTRSLSAMDWLSALLLAPLVEELSYRWVLLRSLDQLLSFVPAAVISATAFSLSHGPQGVDAFASHCWFGLLTAVACYRSGILLVPIASHGALNYLTLRVG